MYYLLPRQLIVSIFFKPPLEPGTVLYEAELSQFAEDIRKWKDRYIVIKNDFAVESYENKEVSYAQVTASSWSIFKTLAAFLSMPWPWRVIDWVSISLPNVVYGSE